MQIQYSKLDNTKLVLGRGEENPKAVEGVFALTLEPGLMSVK